MSEQRFSYGETDLFEWVEVDGEMISTKECVNKLNQQQSTIQSLKEENRKLKFENETLKSNYQKEIQSSIDFCNAYNKTNGELLEEIEKLEQKIKDKNTYQRVLEAKIRRLKDSIKVLEKNGVEPRL